VITEKASCIADDISVKDPKFEPAGWLYITGSHERMVKIGFHKNQKHRPCPAATPSKIEYQ